MRKRNWRMVIGGVFFIAFAAGLFLFLSSLASQSTDPAELLRLSGQASGAIFGVGFVFFILGLIGKKQ